MNSMDRSIKIPDLRFENSFLSSLQRYADFSAENKKGPLAGSESKNINEQIANHEKEQMITRGDITPGIVTYAVIKDIVLRPLFEGFTWAMILILCRPTLTLITAHGHRMGTYLSTIIGSIVPRVHR